MATQQAHPELTDEAGLRRRYLRWPQGLANIGYLVLMHGALLAWLWFGPMLVSYPLYVLFSVTACVIHQRILSEWFHEATHWNLVPDRAWNDRLADLLIGAFNGTRVRSNRPGHFRHHAVREFFADEDPDTRTSTAADRSQLIQGVLCDLCGFNAVRNFITAASQERSSAAPGTLWFVWLLVLHGALFAYTAINGRYEIYPIYFLTLLCLYPLANRLRLYAQHAEILDGGRIGLKDSPVSRSFHGGFLEQLLLHSPMIMYHYEHHAWPNLPYRALAAISTPFPDANRFGTSGLRFVGTVLSGLR